MKYIKSNIKTSAKKLFRAALICSTLNAFVFSTMRITRPRLSNRDIIGSHEQIRCILYDRPPRTGSTTIGKALSSCLGSKGYLQEPLPRAKVGKRRSSAVKHMLKLDTNRRALLTRHIYMSEKDMKLIRTQCHNFLYITSAAPIKERIWSGVKHLLATKHGNTTTDSLNMSQALELLQNQSFEKASLRSLAELNAYPYLTEDAEKAQVREKLIPDYVIRKEFLRKDLQALLQAFDCEASFTTRNVHEDGIKSIDELFSALDFSDDDQLYRYLCKMAELNNPDTLKMAHVFL